MVVALTDPPEKPEDLELHKSRRHVAKLPDDVVKNRIHFLTDCIKKVEKNGKSKFAMNSSRKAYEDEMLSDESVLAWADECLGDDPNFPKVFAGLLYDSQVIVPSSSVVQFLYKVLSKVEYIVETVRRIEERYKAAIMQSLEKSKNQEKPKIEKPLVEDAVKEVPAAVEIPASAPVVASEAVVDVKVDSVATIVEPKVETAPARLPTMKEVVERGSFEFVPLHSDKKVRSAAFRARRRRLQKLRRRKKNSIKIEKLKNEKMAHMASLEKIAKARREASKAPRSVYAPTSALSLSLYDEPIAALTVETMRQLIKSASLLVAKILTQK